MRQKKEFRILLPNEPGQLSKICDALHKNGVNIRTIAGIATHKPTVAVITDQEDKTREVVAKLGLKFKEVELLTIRLTNMPGEIAFYAKKLADANINIDAIYLVGESTSGGEIAFAVSDPERAKQILGLK
jgi:hypothetical protein